jgi:Caspase domain
MPTRKILVRTLALVTLLFVSGRASAGGMHVREDTITINGGPNRIFKPNETISVSFDAVDYEYGANKFKSIFFGVAPSSQKLGRATRASIATWRLFCARMKDASELYRVSKPPARDDEDLEGLMQVQMNFAAPPTPGIYQLVYNRIPAFTSGKLIADGKLGEVIELTGVDRPRAEAAILPFVTNFEKITTFTVSNETQVEDTLTVYLRANGEQPAFANIKGGLTDKPLEFSWFVGPEFRLDKKNVLFRYKIFPIDTDWSAWTADTSVKYHFLPRGTLNFRVEAKYSDKTISFSSQSAKFNFVLLDHLVAKATPSTLSKGPNDKQFESGGKVLETKIAFDTVYAASRALIIGVHTFDDKLSFREFPSDKIQRDVDTLEIALVNNNFVVSKLFKDRLTRDDIMTAVETLVNGSKENDRLFIYFSSHGFADKNSNSDGYIATSDCEYNSPSVRCIRLADIGYQAKRALEGKKVRQVLIAVDSCFSGLGIISKAAGIPDYSRLAVAPGAYMLTAGMADQLAQIDPDLRMSTFTYFLAKGLQGDANIFDKNGIISLTELFLYTQYNVAKQTDSKQIPMLGRLIGDGEMLFRPQDNKK